MFLHVVANCWTKPDPILYNMDYFLKLSMQIGDDDDFVGNVNGDDDEENVMLAVKLKVAKLVFGLLDWAELYSSVIHCSSSINNIYHEDDCDDDCE